MLKWNWVDKINYNFQINFLVFACVQCAICIDHKLLSIALLPYTLAIVTPNPAWTVCDQMLHASVHDYLCCLNWYVRFCKSFSQCQECDAVIGMLFQMFRVWRDVLLRLSNTSGIQVCQTDEIAGTFTWVARAGCALCV